MSVDEARWLEGRRVLVTGAAGVLGRALVAEADLRGAAVVAAGRSPTSMWNTPRRTDTAR